ncbi:hypothetical protein C6A88_00555, partial [Mycolicibacterium austroafricanum]
MVDELIERTEMELDYRLEADNQRAFAKAYAGDPHFVVPHVVAELEEPGGHQVALLLSPVPDDVRQRDALDPLLDDDLRRAG